MTTPSNQPTAYLSTLRPEHPRLFLLAGEEAQIRDRIQRDPLAAEYFQRLLSQGEEILPKPLVERKFVGIDPSYMYMLLESREAIHRIHTTALLYRLTGEARWLDRAVREMLNAASFVDWNPAHWLDVAEMINALAVGYDWLYHDLTPEQREIIRDAIVNKGLREAEIAYWDAPERLARGRGERRAWWARNAFNWNNVCNGGIIIGALAVAEDEPELAEKLLAEALVGLPYALASYAPDGAWAEGPAYWGYATLYTALGFAALESALGSDFGLGNLPGIADAGWFRMHGTGPLGKYFNFADAAEESSFDPTLYYLAIKYQNPAYARAAEFSRQIGFGHPRWGTDARALIWYQPEKFVQFPEPGNVPLDAWYQNTHVVFFRTDWNDRNAYYVGFKGGDNKANHSHLDLGEFVFDALGERWVSDLCGDLYIMPGYFDISGPRWQYYRINTQGHNTLLINGQSQHPRAEAPMTSFSAAPEAACATADLTAAYAHLGAKKITRRIELGENRTALTVEDTVELTDPTEIEWRIHTPAAVEIHGSEATLTQNNKRVIVQLLEPKGAQFEAVEVHLDPPQNPLEGITRLMIRVKDATQTRFKVRFVPQKG